MNFLKREIFWNILEIIFILVFVVLPIRIFLMEPFFVRGDSMEPNFHSWDYLIVDKFTYLFKNPERGDVIVFHPPFDDSIYYIKRIIGLPGEKLIIEGDKITIYNKENPNGFFLKEDYLQGHYTSGRIEVRLENDEYFVLGDNREVSYDSRKWGPLKRNRIVGKVFFHLSLVKLTQAIGIK